MLPKYLIRPYMVSQELNETVSSGLDGCVAGVYGPDGSFPATWTTRRRVASTRCSTVAVCLLVEHDGLEEVRRPSVVAKIGQDFNSDVH